MKSSFFIPGTARSISKESLFSKKNMKLIKDPLNDSNPISIQVLGICSALAITIMLENAFVMSMSVLFVLIMGFLMSLLMTLIITYIYTVYV